MAMSHARERAVAVLASVVLGCCALVSEVASAAESQSAWPRTLYLIRHGAYVADRNADPQLGPGLTPLGVAQARLIAARLGGSGISFDSMTSSTLLRARETAAVMHETLANVPLGQSPLLSECTPWGFEATSDSVARERAECARQLDQAFAEFFTVAKGAGRNDILVAHGNVIRYLVVKALKVEPRAWRGMSVAHASMTVIQVQRDGSMVVRAVGDSGHIPGPLLSWGEASDRQLVVPAAR
jgi:serine/threonine-protein phosphatase PGAM5